MLHYNFPPFCVGEVEVPARPEPARDRPRRARRARAVAGAARTRAISRTRSASSPRSSSRTARRRWRRCAAARLSLMDAGVPIKAPVAGIAMGLIKEGDDIAVLSDILGDEDHLGDMDFKVAGTSEGVTALQMDIKIDGVTARSCARRSQQAREGASAHPRGDGPRRMRQARGDISAHAPRIVTLKIRTGQDPRHHRPRWQDHPRHRRGDGLQDRHRGRRHGASSRRATAAAHAARHRDHRRHHRRGGGREDLQGHRSGASSTSARSSRSCRAPTACCTSRRSRPEPRAPRRRRAQGGRRDPGQGARGRSRPGRSA